MIVEALGSLLLGLVLASLAALWLPHRMPPRLVLLPTGAAGALLGAFVTHSALGPGHPGLTLLGALALGAAALSLLLRPSRVPAAV
ncbi:hypothetical protein [Streptomyces sp. NPDC050560]|uniref:hypothetical protein n=1 Tax=Streptomyces sp. NPDC050560 TaxID=3365630 RepID=UPI0037B9464D